MPNQQIQKREDNSPAAMYRDAVNIGTEEVTQDDLNTPILKIIQPNTQDITNKQDGSFYRSDLKEQLESVEVNFVYVTTVENENYNKTGKEKVKIYFGFYKGSNEPFRMYLRGWAMADHRNFQTEMISIKNRYKVPMLALTVKLTTYKQTGIIQDTGKPYTTYRPLFTIEKVDGKPVIEMNPDRISFLVEASTRFKELALTTSTSDEIQNEIPEEEVSQEPPMNDAESEVNLDDIPF